MADLSGEIGKNVGYLIWRLSMRWRASVDRALAPHGLTQAQYAVLAPLYGMTRGGARPSQRELADMTGLDAMYISKLVRALERAGFVTRTTSPADPRAVAVTMTEHGEATMRQTMGIVATLRDELTAPLGGTDGERTAELTAMLRALLEADIDAPASA